MLPSQAVRVWFSIVYHKELWHPRVAQSFADSPCLGFGVFSEDGGTYSRDVTLTLLLSRVLKARGLRQEQRTVLVSTKAADNIKVDLLSTARLINVMWAIDGTQRRAVLYHIYSPRKHNYCMNAQGVCTSQCFPKAKSILFIQNTIRLHKKSYLSVSQSLLVYHAKRWRAYSYVYNICMTRGGCRKIPMLMLNECSSHQDKWLTDDWLNIMSWSEFKVHWQYEKPCLINCSLITETVSDVWHPCLFFKRLI